MNLSDKQLSLIEKYLDKDLSTAEQIEFEENLKDPEFKDQLLFQSKLLDKLETSTADSALLSKDITMTKPQANLQSLILRLVIAVLLIIAIVYAMIRYSGN